MTATLAVFDQISTGSVYAITESSGRHVGYISFTKLLNGRVFWDRLDEMGTPMLGRDGECTPADLAMSENALADDIWFNR